MQEQTTFEQIEQKDMSRANRMSRSVAARRRRRSMKDTREIRMQNRFAKARRARKRN